MTDSSSDGALSIHLNRLAIPSERAIPHVEEAVQLFGSLRRPLLRYALTFGIDVFDAEEVVQETFLALFKHLECGKSDGNLPGWVFRVCHNLAIKHIEKNCGIRKVAAVDVDWLNGFADRQLNPEEQLLQEQRRQKLQSVLRALPEQDRCCICLRAEGLRYREIAEILGMSLGAVSISLTRSLARFERADQE
jgi:RNA polymerase sigma-70 factor (ECF subfamily)